MCDRLLDLTHAGSTYRYVTYAEVTASVRRRLQSLAWALYMRGMLRPAAAYLRYWMKAACSGWMLNPWVRWMPMHS